MTFKRDKKIGDIGENALAYRLTYLGKRKAEIAEGYHPAWDVRTDDGQTFEVKTDRQSHETGNWFVEVEDHGKPSGIRTSKADWWCFFENKTGLMHLVQKDILLEHMRTTFKALRRCENAGDGTTGYLISKKAVKGIKDSIVYGHD